MPQAGRDTANFPPTINGDHAGDDVTTITTEPPADLGPIGTLRTLAAITLDVVAAVVFAAVVTMAAVGPAPSGTDAGAVAAGATVALAVGLLASVVFAVANQSLAAAASGWTLGGALTGMRLSTDGGRWRLAVRGLVVAVLPLVLLTASVLPDLSVWLTLATALLLVAGPLPDGSVMTDRLARVEMSCRGRTVGPLSDGFVVAWWIAALLAVGGALTLA
jgi:hypothetical protein